MTLGAPPKSIGIQLDRSGSSTIDGPDTFPRYRFTTEYAVTTNPTAVEHLDQDDSSMLVHRPDSELVSSAIKAEEPSHIHPQDLASMSSGKYELWTPSRSRASTPKAMARRSAGATPSSHESEIEHEAQERGRTRARLECIIPPRSRKISKRGVLRRVGNSQSGSGSADAETFLTSESPSPSNSSGDAQGEVLEPPPAEYVARGFTERLSEQGSPASPEDGVPFPHDEGITDMASSRPSRASNQLSIIEPAHFQHHRDTFAILELPKHRPLPPSPPELCNLPYPILFVLDKHLDHASRLALRSTCRWLRDSILEMHPLRFPTVSRLPVEMIQEIFAYLPPVDFNSARHTCRTWMRASLDKNLLARMVRKGGWWTSVEMTMRRYLARSGADEDDFPSVWLLSSLLARECALTPGWKGNGFSKSRIVNSSKVRIAQTDGAFDEDYVAHARQLPLEQVLEADFSALGDPKVYGNAVPTYAQARGLREGVQFTASVCSRFVLVTQGCQIFVYCLSHAVPYENEKSGSQGRFGGLSAASKCQSKVAIIYPVTTIICPRRVLSVSMDTSCGRCAVAALLDERMGLVCDLFGSGEASAGGFWSSKASLEPVSIFPQPASGRDYTSLAGPSSRSSSTLFGQDSPTLSPQLLRTQTSHHPHTAHSYPIPIETGPRSIYRALCANDDPPLSIAICPQRRCVAFGCTTGLELHWVDALTGQDLNRWFPLTAPSDYLYFLPPRKGVDNAKKLRLVSSSGLPGMKGRLRERFNSRRGYNWSASMGMGLGYGGWRDAEDLGQDSGDNYRTIPLSNGHHVLFTDRADQKLCLGIDAPVFGPNRMTKKVIFEGPKGALPAVYAVGRDLSWGVRVAAGYGDEIWLFTVPADIFTCEGNGDGELWLEQYVPAEKLTHLRGVRAAKALLTHSPLPASVIDRDTSEDSGSIWPITVFGVRIATVPGLSEIAVNSRPASFTIWAFASDGIARAWQMRGGKPRDVKTATVLRDGSIVEERHEAEAPDGDIRAMRHDFEVDADGDVLMQDAPPLTEISLPGLEWTTHTSFDGYMSRSSSLNPSRKPSRRFSARAGHEPPPTTPVPATSPAAPATPILQGVDAALRDASSSPTTGSPSLQSRSSPLPSIIEHSIGDILTADLDSEGFWSTIEEEAKKEASRERVAASGQGPILQTGRVHTIDHSDFFGLANGQRDEAADGAGDGEDFGHLELEILG